MLDEIPEAAPLGVHVAKLAADKTQGELLVDVLSFPGVPHDGGQEGFDRRFVAMQQLFHGVAGSGRVVAVRLLHQRRERGDLAQVGFAF